MNVETRIISCGNCGQKLRIPFDRTRLIVTCPQCRNGWEWTADEPPPATANRTRKLISISLGVLAALVLIAGVWTRSWLPTGLFALSLVVRWICRFRLAYNDPKKLWEKGAGVLLEATAGLAGAVAIGLALVIGLVTFLNVYPNLSPGNYPGWLVKLEHLFITISGWTETPNNKLRITVVYLAVIAFCFLLSLVARRYKKEWKPVSTLTRFKQTANKALLAIQVVALFTLFSHAPVTEHVDKLAEQQLWRYKVAKRAEQEFEARRLIAEEMTRAVREHQDVAQEEKDTFAQSISDLRSSLEPVQVIANPTSSINPGQSGPSSGPTPDPAPSGPGSWRPSNWPRPPDAVFRKIKTGTPLEATDHLPVPIVTNRFKWSDNSRSGAANDLVARQIDTVIPRTSSAIPDSVLFDANATKIFPPKTTQQWSAARELLAEQELKADLAERRYGQAVQVLLEGVSEYLSVKIPSDPFVGTWIDLALNNIADRVYEKLFAKDSAQFVKVSEQLQALFTPRETKAMRLKDQIENHLRAGEYDAAESSIAELEKYPKTTAARSLALLAEETSFGKVSRSVSSDIASVETITQASKYLLNHGSSKRARQVREWLAYAKTEKDRREIDGAKPQMLVYLREDCAMSQRYRDYTAHDSEVIAERTRFRYKVFDIDQTPPAVSFGARRVSLPIIVFQDRNGNVVDTLTGDAALKPTTLTMQMRAVVHRKLPAGRFTVDPLEEIYRRLQPRTTTPGSGCVY